MSNIGDFFTEIPESGFRQFTADGDVANGELVIVTSAGKVTAVVDTGDGPFEAGTPIVFESSSTSISIATAFDSVNNKVVVAYVDTGNSNHGTAIVGTVSGSAISFGIAVVFEAASTNFISIDFDSTAGKFVISYQDVGNSSFGTAIVGTVSGTSISFGTAVVFEAATTLQTATAYESAANKTVIAYRDAGNSNFGTAIVGTVSGTSISFGTAVVFASTVTVAPAIVSDVGAGKVVIGSRDSTAGNLGEAIVGTVSGTSISFGAIATFNAANTAQISMAYDSTATKTVFVFQDSGDSSKGKAIVGTVSGTTISFGVEAEFESVAISDTAVTYDSTSDKSVISWNITTPTEGQAVVGTVSGTSISFGTAITIGTAGIGTTASTYDPSNDRVILSYSDTDNSSFGTSVALDTFGPNSNANNQYVGIAAEAIADTAIGNVTLEGGVSTNQSGLTAGLVFFTDDAGNLTTTSSATLPQVGVALSATDILLFGVVP